jgi:hypothetical protein
VHVQDTWQEHEARDGGPQTRPCDGISLPAAPEGFAGKTGSGSTTVQESHIRSRLFLAHAFLQIRARHTEDQRAILGGKAALQCNPGQEEQDTAAQDGLARLGCVGVLDAGLTPPCEKDRSLPSHLLTIPQSHRMNEHVIESAFCLCG